MLWSNPLPDVQMISSHSAGSLHSFVSFAVQKIFKFMFANGWHYFRNHWSSAQKVSLCLHLEAFALPLMVLEPQHNQLV